MNKKQLFLAIFIIGIMISSVIGFVYINPNDTNTNSFDYNGFKFSLDANNNRYNVNVNGANFIFDYDPRELNNIELPNFIIRGQKYYILTNTTELDSNLDYSINKLRYNLGLLEILTFPACINEQECNTNLPIKDCDTDAFYFKKSNINQVSLENKCIIIEGDTLVINQLVDKISLRLSGV